MSPVTLANIYLRLSYGQQNPRQYLTDKLADRIATLEAQQGGVITSTTVNGKSVTYQSKTGVATDDQALAYELALKALECGLPSVPSTTWGVMR